MPDKAGVFVKRISCVKVSINSCGTRFKESFKLFNVIIWGFIAHFDTKSWTFPILFICSQLNFVLSSFNRWLPQIYWFRMCWNIPTMRWLGMKKKINSCIYFHLLRKNDLWLYRIGINLEHGQWRKWQFSILILRFPCDKTRGLTEVTKHSFAIYTTLKCKDIQRLEKCCSLCYYRAPTHGSFALLDLRKKKRGASRTWSSTWQTPAIKTYSSNTVDDLMV